MKEVPKEEEGLEGQSQVAEPEWMAMVTSKLDLHHSPPESKVAERKEPRVAPKVEPEGGSSEVPENHLQNLVATRVQEDPVVE